MVHPGPLSCAAAWCDATAAGVPVAGLLEGWHAADLGTVKRLGRPPRAGERHPLTALQWDLPVPAFGGSGGGGDAPVTVTAAPLLHRLPCWGYVFQEAAPAEAVPRDPQQAVPQEPQQAPSPPPVSRAREACSAS